jgi:branched-chain amino acid transport system permease protein
MNTLTSPAPGGAALAAVPAAPPARAWWLPLVLLLVLAALPTLAQAAGLEFYIGLVRRILLFALAAASLNFLIGDGGMIALGHAGFIGTGAYTVVALTDFGVQSAWPIWAAAMAVSALAAVAIGAISLRTRGVYFIMITLAFAQMLYYVCMTQRQWGGEDGYTLPMRPQLGFGLDAQNEAVMYQVVLALVAVAWGLLDRLRGSRFGVAVMGIRDNDVRMQALGYPVYRLRLVAFAIAGALAGLSGALLATCNSFVSPSMMHWTESAMLIVMVILGGLGQRWGGPVGALVWLGLAETLRQFTEHWQMPLGVLLVAVALYAPAGLATFRLPRRGGAA